MLMTTTPIIEGKRIRKNQTCRLTKTMRFKKYKNDAYKKKGERGPIQHDQSPPFFFHLNPL